MRVRQVASAAVTFADPLRPRLFLPPSCSSPQVPDVRPYGRIGSLTSALTLFYERYADHAADARQVVYLVTGHA